MGKPAPPITEPSAAGGSSSLDNSNADTFSLHSNPANTMGFSSGFDDDIPELQSHDLPPLYSDIDAEGGGESSALLLAEASPEPRNVVEPRQTDKNTGDVFFLTSFFEERPEELMTQINSSASVPPRAHVRVLGTHSAMVDEGGKKKKQTVTDFDVLVEVTPYLFSDATRQRSYMEVRTVENSEKARRGTVFKKRAPESKQDIELLEVPKPTLKEWCHRYCASSARVKCFTLQRRVLGFDEEKIRKLLTDLVRSTNYRGNVQVNLQVLDQYVTVYNDCFVNRSRLTAWIVWLCYLTFLWLLTWPFLFFATKKFEVVTADWNFSGTDDNGVKRYVSISEDHWYNTWARAIHNAVMLKKQTTLDHNDLVASHSSAPTAIDQALEGAPGFVRSGVQLFTAVHRSIGWGGDTC
ncbi:hypothetical protein QBC42DRAFT_263537 [Cladorrhinum samala]|uniref:Uncharacterized protein n=1 Tax=Cladorrhinum samala TaxID=585594 RepID=A0AAV9HW10_9PEZI|nr:hypothetical protein QBC42DRAFT_263537 [Cladorrhinum samala]